jgi:hypothetical protein
MSDPKYHVPWGLLAAHYISVENFDNRDIWLQKDRWHILGISWRLIPTLSVLLEQYIACTIYFCINSSKVWRVLEEKISMKLLPDIYSDDCALRGWDVLYYLANCQKESKRANKTCSSSSICSSKILLTVRIAGHFCHLEALYNPSR